MPHDVLIACANCGQTILEADAEAAGWRFWSDGLGELQNLFCRGLAERELG